MTKQTIDKLNDEESWAVVKQNENGRVASAREGAPDIYPVSFVVHNWCIYFRTGVDSRLRSDTEGKLVAFETAVQEAHSFSSTVSLGVLTVVTDEQEIAELEQLPIIDFAPRTNYVWMALKPQELRGRRLNVLSNGNDQ
jgi:nitroimidazol reductase NimA-like FMN-containing flavoprotein (pyridoxamine 5'-phosphate oxidase superfamily)